MPVASPLAAVLLSLVLAPSVAAAPADLTRLEAGDRHHGFETTTIWLDASDRPLGARFRHPRTGFQLDVLLIESVPQAFTWVKSFATGDQGEPHTQEHLLLLRGLRGRTLSNKQAMSLATHSAYTETWRTSYFFNTAAGVDTFFDIFAEQQRAMLHPDHSDAEIRLEVRNFGVTKNPDGTLRLEEKGSVYAEMVASTANAASKASRARNHAVYGEGHPLGYNQGGEPSGIRTMTPADIRKFHKQTHHLANMGTVAAFPRSVPLDTVLARFNAILTKDAPAGAPRAADSLAKLPPPAGDPEGAVRIYEYPHTNAQQPSPLEIVWPAARKLDAGEQLLAELFFANVASDTTTNFYKLFIDGRTRRLDIGARSVGAKVGEWGGYPISIFFSDVRPSDMSDEGVRKVRSLVVEEIARIAALHAGSPELKEFNDRIASRVIERERAAAKFVATPPRFGARGGNSAWVNLLLKLESSPGTRKSLVMKPEFAQAKKLLASDENFWREYLTKWKVTNVTPYVTGARPSPALITREDAERRARLDEETEKIRRRYGMASTQAALERYGAEVDSEFARIEKAIKAPPVPFVKAPPMTLDDDIQYESVRLTNGVPLVASRFDDMSGALAGIALRLDGLPRDELRYVSLLPELLGTVGVIENGGPVSHERMSERLRREILALTLSFSSNPRTGRVELVVRGSGVGLEESRLALDWMALVLLSPDWRPDNLPRMRDVVDQALAQLRNTTQRPEEYWTGDPANAYHMQRHPAYLAAGSFLTRTHNALRLRWLLKDPAPADTGALHVFLTRLAEVGRGMARADLKAMLAGKAPGLEALTGVQRAIADEALRDLDLTLVDIPDASLGADFVYLASAIRDDLATPVGEVLAKMDTLRRKLLRAGGARLFLVSSGELRKEMASPIEAFAARLASADLAPIQDRSEPIIDARLRMRDADASPVHVGLYAPNKQGGALTTSVPTAHFADAGDREKELDYLALRLYGGGGSNSLFSKLVTAGLSYGGGIRSTVSTGRGGLYVERTPDLPQTVRFAAGFVKDATIDRTLGEYVMAQAFSETRASETYESRAEGLAADLADGQPPEQVRAFRKAMLELRKDPKLVEKLFERKDRVHARTIPGYGTRPLTAADGVYMAIGPDKQLDAWEHYLKETEGANAKLYRLYGRDFWMP